MRFSHEVWNENTNIRAGGQPFHWACPEAIPLNDEVWPSNQQKMIDTVTHLGLKTLSGNFDRYFGTLQILSIQWGDWSLRSSTTQVPPLMAVVRPLHRSVKASSNLMPVRETGRTKGLVSISCAPPVKCVWG